MSAPARYVLTMFFGSGDSEQERRVLHFCVERLTLSVYWVTVTLTFVSFWSMPTVDAGTAKPSAVPVITAV